MYTPPMTLSLLYLLWLPCTVLGSFQVLIQSSSTGGYKPGDTLAYTLVADPIPSGALGIILIPVQSGAASTPRPFTMFSATMEFSPQKFTLTMPSQLADSFYTLDAHAEQDVQSTLLGYSDPFEILNPTTTTSSNTPTQQTTTTKTTITSPSDRSTTSNASPPTSQSSSSPSSNSQSSTTPTTSSPPSSSPADTHTSTPNAETGTTPNSAADASPTSSSSSSDASTDKTSATTTSATSKKTPTGAIVGGVIGGIAVLLFLLFTFFFCRRRRQLEKLDDMLLGDDNHTSNNVNYNSSTTAFMSQHQHSPSSHLTSQSEISPFIINDSGRDMTGHTASPEFSSAKSREAFGFGAGGGGAWAGAQAQARLQPQRHVAAAPSMSLSVGSTGDSVVPSSGASQSQNQSASRLPLLGGVTSKPTPSLHTAPRGVTAPSTDAAWSGYANSAASAFGRTSAGASDEGMGAGAIAIASAVVGAGAGAGVDDRSENDVRERLEQLTSHVRRLEDALEQAVSHQQGYDAPPVYDGSQR
ncbi:hypothetical protein BDN70DRAFT_881628 [Pholiota conissans]|uniref:Mid2 domain-containing protein n=1 Tax=Pholiota conissans TaxID=109636 RepID=A0A9P6CSA3_9AGAR|nr:hypothetical protein BDN70DRAFT_881628 [Pholiota conissans]